MDFAVQELDSPVLGCQAHQPRLTPGMMAHNEHLAKLAASRANRQQNQVPTQVHHNAGSYTPHSIRSTDDGMQQQYGNAMAADNGHHSNLGSANYSESAYTGNNSAFAAGQDQAQGFNYGVGDHSAIYDTDQDPYYPQNEQFSQCQYFPTSSADARIHTHATHVTISDSVPDKTSDTITSTLNHSIRTAGTTNQEQPPAGNDVQLSIPEPPAARLPTDQMASTPLSAPKRKLVCRGLVRKDTPYPFDTLNNVASPRLPSPSPSSASGEVLPHTSAVNLENISPEVGPKTKRSRNKDCDVADNTSPTPSQKVSKKERPTAGVLSRLQRRVAKVAWVYFRARIATINPFPNEETADRWAIDSWFEAIEDQRDNLDLGDDSDIPDELLLDAEDIIVPLICQRESQLCGQLVTKTKDLIPSMYGFKPRKTAEIINYNRERYEKLVTKDAYLYKDPHNRDAPGTLYKHEIFGTVLNMQWFSADAKSEGIVMSKYFNAADPDAPKEGPRGIPLIRNALDEWATGYRKCINFDAKVYEEHYKKHLKYIQNWKTYTKTRRRTVTMTV
ncbi:hypothetical protein BJ138DRAFT_1107154 [Hygrophoropsis aurantiaca]|uniref:Uncharacterized protein n=1 Tax=Hygrophoropsis aurantiaca TaxID=72124 RepID=A0ACB7ZT52_9AGAM|nr:hypothetical protein BJ138DRAFT_1107154 [Hygrophoropsis aurantiaca]